MVAEAGGTMFWLRPKLSLFWKHVFDALREQQQDTPQTPQPVVGAIADGPRQYTALKYTSISWLKLTYNGRIQENMGHFPGTNHIFIKTY